MSRFTSLLLSLILSIPLFAETPVISDMGAARDYCDDNPLQNIEGIWEYPDDSTCVLIKKSDDLNYDIILVTSPDCRLQPGDVIGSLHSQADPTKFDMKIYREKRHNVFSNPGKCTASLDNSKGVIFVEAQKLKFSVSSFNLWFLPRFWRTIRIGFSNPNDKLKKGLIRVYPEVIGREKRYL